MAQILRPGFSTNIALQFVKEIQLLKSNFYYFIGKVSSWNVDDLPPETIPLTFEEEIAARDNLLYAGKITPNDVSMCVPRYDWTSGTVYTKWDHTLVMKDAPFYVMSNFRVYKCLDNNNGIPSTSQPTEADGIYAYRATDGYVWKYMYSIPEFKQLKFVNATNIPVQTALNDSFYNRGAIEELSIINRGSGYTVNANTIITVSGPGTGAVLTPVINAQGNIIRVIISEPGSGYVTAPTLSVSGSGVQLYPENSGVATAIIEAVVSAGEIVQVSIIDPGISYTTNSNTAITVTGDGTGASFSAIVYDGELVDVVVNNSGSGYSYAKVVITGAGSGASVVPLIGLSDVISDQSTVEQTTTAGAIYSNTVTVGGDGYTTTPNVVILGDGVGATAQAFIDAGAVVKVTMTAFGSGYSYANFVIDPSDTEGGVTAVVEPIYGPYKGHGYDAINELLSDTVCVSSVLSANDIITEIGQDYRQYGIIKNPLNIYTKVTLNVSDTLACHVVTMLSTVGLEVDMILTSTQNYKYIVVKFDSTTVWLQSISNTSASPTGALSFNGASFFSTAVLSSPILDKYSGELILLSSEEPFSFAAEQNVALKTFIKC